MRDCAPPGPPRRWARPANVGTRGHEVPRCGRRRCWPRVLTLGGSRSCPSARITRVSGWIPSFFIASAGGSVCMNCWNAAKSGISTIIPTRFEPCGSLNVRRVIPRGPKTSSRLGELSQWSPAGFPTRKGLSTAMTRRSRRRSLHSTRASSRFIHSSTAIIYKGERSRYLAALRRADQRTPQGREGG